MRIMAYLKWMFAKNLVKIVAETRELLTFNGESCSKFMHMLLIFYGRFVAEIYLSYHLNLSGRI